jgi:hypothetical protein
MFGLRLEVAAFVLEYADKQLIVLCDGDVAQLDEVVAYPKELRQGFTDASSFRLVTRAYNSLMPPPR